MPAMASHTMLGRYRLGERLGRGGLGEVFAAETDGPDGFRKRVVIKRIRSALIENAEVLRRFVDEAKLVAGLSHGNIVQVLDFAEDGGERFIVMEYVDGCSVDALLTSPSAPKEGIGLAELLYVVESVCAALHYAHVAHQRPGALPLVHRDVTPANVLLSKAGVVKLADFGIAASAGVRDASGTPTFAAPEQLAGEPVDVRADVYSVGQLMKFMLKHVPASELAALDDAHVLADIARKASSKAIDERYADVELLRQDLERWRAGHSIPHAPGRLASWVSQVAATRQLARMQLASEIAASRWTVAPRTAALHDGAVAAPVAEVPSRRTGMLAGMGVVLLAGFVVIAMFDPFALDSADATKSGDGQLISGRRGVPAPEPGGELERSTTNPPSDSVGEANTKAPGERPSAQGGSSAQSDGAPLDTGPVAENSSGSAEDGASLVGSKPHAKDHDKDQGKDLDKSPEKKSSGKTLKSQDAVATLRVNLLPYALVELDGTSIGKTPLKRSIPAGEHTLSLLNPETGKERTVTFSIESGATHEVISW